MKAENKIKIGITGSTGVLGRAITSKWTEPEFIPFKGDIRKFSDLKEWYEVSGPFDGILHLAALVPVDAVQKDPFKAFQINVLGTCHLLELVRETPEAKRPWTFYCSSSHVYKTSLDPLGEEATISPITIYGETKAQADRWCEIYRENYHLPICVGRIFSNSSPQQPSSYFVPTMIKKITEAPPKGVLEVRGLGGTRDFLTVDQIVHAIQFLFEKKLCETFNIGTGTPIKLFDLVSALKNRLGREDVVVRVLESETNHLVANVEKLAHAGLKLDFKLESFLDSVVRR